MKIFSESTLVGFPPNMPPSLKTQIITRAKQVKFLNKLIYKKMKHNKVFGVPCLGGASQNF